jgi:hypothetical protein
MVPCQQTYNNNNGHINAQISEQHVAVKVLACNILLYESGFEKCKLIESELVLRIVGTQLKCVMTHCPHQGDETVAELVYHCSVDGYLWR